jgi:hypothetical protein
MSSQPPISQPPQIPGSPPREPFKRPDPDAQAVTSVETQFFDSESSPVKPRKNLDNLKDIRLLPEATDKAVDENFTQDHLSDLPFSPDTWWDEDCGALAATIGAAKNKPEIEMYPVLCKLLNRISERIYGKPSPCFATQPADVFVPQHHWNKRCDQRT